MSNEYIDNVLEKAREVFGVAVTKTEEVVTVEKLKYNLSVIKNSREKDLAELGVLYYKLLKEAEEMDEETEELVTSIAEKTAKIKELKEEISNVKNKKQCDNCGNFVATDSSYCKNCGCKF